jgi:hypothetical protein
MVITALDTYQLVSQCAEQLTRCDLVLVSL